MYSSLGAQYFQGLVYTCLHETEYRTEILRKKKKLCCIQASQSQMKWVSQPCSHLMSSVHHGSGLQALKPELTKLSTKAASSSLADAPALPGGSTISGDGQGPGAKPVAEAD